MIKSYLTVVLMALLASACQISTAAEPATKVHKVKYSLVKASLIQIPGLPDEYKDLQWHLYETQNFEALAIDQSQAMAIAERCEELKTWTQERWGFQDTSYNKKCMILCVPNDELFKKWFRRSHIAPKVAKSKTPEGTDRDVYAIWMSGGDRFVSKKLPELITRVNMLNHESVHKVKLPCWAQVGMSALNNDITSLRELLANQGKGVTVGELFKQEFDSSGNVEDADFRANAAAFCLMMRKSSGHANFNKFMSAAMAGDSAQALGVYGQNINVPTVEVLFASYRQTLARDLQSGRVPNMGLTWFTPKKVAR